MHVVHINIYYAYKLCPKKLYMLSKKNPLNYICCAMNTHTLCLLVLWFRMTSYVIYRIISILHLSILSAPFVVVVVAIITKNQSFNKITTNKKLQTKKSSHLFIIYEWYVLMGCYCCTITYSSSNVQSSSSRRRRRRRHRLMGPNWTYHKPKSKYKL